jgi:hypothetical protein
VRLRTVELANVVAAATGIGEAARLLNSARLPSSQRQGPSAPGPPNFGLDQLPKMASDTRSPGGKGIEGGASEGALSISERADARDEGGISISDGADARELLLAPSGTREEGEASKLGNSSSQESEDAARRLARLPNLEAEDVAGMRARQCSEETTLSSEQPGNLFPQPSFASETSDYSHQVPDEQAPMTAPGERVPLWMLSASHKSMQVGDVDLRCRSEGHCSLEFSLRHHDCR